MQCALCVPASQTGAIAANGSELEGLEREAKPGARLRLPQVGKGEGRADRQPVRLPWRTGEVEAGLRARWRRACRG